MGILFTAVTLAIFIIAMAIYLGRKHCLSPQSKTIKVGILHSLTGTMAINGNAVKDATLMAIQEINDNGGLLGKKIHPIIKDGRSDWAHFAKLTEYLINKDKVCVVFGCWASAGRKSVKPLFEKYNHLLIYPVQYEGLEESPNIIYNGAAPNQQIIPTVKWAFDNLGKTFFLVGSDYIFPHAANAIIHEQIKALGGKVVGEEYVLLGGIDIDHIINKIFDTKPDVIINTLNGDSNIPFFKSLRDKGIHSDKTPTISFSMGENMLTHMNAAELAGDYAAGNYFQNIPNEINHRFIKNYKRKYGEHRVTDDSIESAYFGVYLWAQAVKDAQTEDVNKVRPAMKGQTYVAPEGTVYVDPKNQHTWKTVRIGKIRADGQFDIIWSSLNPIQPIPYPVYRTKAEWESFLNQLYISWGNNWANGIQQE